MWPVHIPKLATFQASCFLSFHPHKHTHRHHCHQQPPPATIAWHVPHCPNGDNPCCHHCPLYSRWAVYLPNPSPFFMWEAGVPFTNVATNDGQAMTWHVNRCATLSGWWQCMSLFTVLIITGEQPPFFVSYQMQGATSHWQCGNHMTQDKRWVMTMTNDCTTTIIIAVIIIVSPSIPPLPFPTQLTSHHHQTKDSGHSHVTPPQWQSAMTTTDHDHNDNTTRWPCNNHSTTTSCTDHLLHHYCFALIFSLSY